MVLEAEILFSPVVRIEHAPTALRGLKHIYYPIPPTIFNQLFNNPHPGLVIDYNFYSESSLAELPQTTRGAPGCLDHACRVALCRGAA